MAEAPQLFADPSTSGVSLFYVAPPSGEYNVAAAFLSNYLRRRAPQQDAVFAAKLRAMDPTARYAQLAKMADTRSKLLDQLAANERNRATNATTLAKGANDLVAEGLKLHGINTQAQAQIAAANIGRDTELMKQRAVKEGGQKIVTDATAAINETRDALARAAQMAPGAARNQAEADAWTAYDRRMQDNSKAASVLTNPGERDAVREAIQGQLATIALSDSDLKSGMQEIGNANFPAPATQEVRQYGVGSRDLDSVVREAKAAAQILSPAGQGQSRPPPAGGGSSAQPAETPPAGGPSSQRSAPAGTSPQTSGRGSSGGSPPAATSSGNTSRGPVTTGGSDEQILEAVGALDELMRRLEAEDPMAPLDKLTRRLGTGVNLEPRARGGEKKPLRLSFPSRKEKPASPSSTEKAAKMLGFDDLIGDSKRDIPDPTAPVRRTVGSTVTEPPKEPKKKRPSDKAAAFIGPDTVYGPPDIRESDGETDEERLGESEQPKEDRTGESEQPAKKPRGLAGVYGMNDLPPASLATPVKPKAPKGGRSAGQRIDAPGVVDDEADESAPGDDLAEAQKRRRRKG